MASAIGDTSRAGSNCSRLHSQSRKFSVVADWQARTPGLSAPQSRIVRIPNTDSLTARLPTPSALGKGHPPVASVYIDTSPEGVNYTLL